MDCVTDACGICFGNENGVAAIMFEGWSDVPSGSTMWGPRTAFVSCFVGDDFGARWRKRGAVVVKVAKKLSVG